MNARGAMEIVLGLLALEAGVIGKRLFVALVVMAILTSLFSGVSIHRVLSGRKAREARAVPRRGFVRLRSADPRGVLSEFTPARPARARATTRRPTDRSNSASGCASSFCPAHPNTGLVIVRSQLPELKEPVVVVGVSGQGIDFSARDGQPAKLICLVLTPADDLRFSAGLLVDIGRSFPDADHVEHAASVQNYTEFLALLNSGRPAERRVLAEG